MFIMKRLLALSIFSATLLFSASSMATIFSYITESKQVGYDGADYTFIIQRWDPEPPSALNPCYGWKRCYITINHRHQPDQSGGVATKFILDNGHKYRTMEQLRTAVLKKLGGLPYGPDVAVHRKVDTSLLQECVGLFYQSNQYGYASSGRLLPGSSCGIAPPPVGSCQIIEGSVDLDYGNVNEDELNNARRAKNIRVTCNKDMRIQVVATGMVSDRIPLRNNNSLYANLYLNGKSGEQGEIISVAKDRATTVEVSSILRTNGRVEPGRFSGSGALILTLP
ncbi:adhesin [Proteus myxofaciens]|uniref:MrfJ family protein n=1 Tax=Proteus myxofaciens ATCC 19692 TaxID=1354337 RepID=A0A198FKM7_9GAMM|nr:adhesin [Proteus myxofaciens]OAT24999.1 MrfJ family protein [Proteus myxofaciens ATCC 19692]